MSKKTLTKLLYQYTDPNANLVVQKFFLNQITEILKSAASPKNTNDRQLSRFCEVF